MKSPATARPQRPPVPPLPEFDRLDRTHAAAMQMLEAFERLLQHLDDRGLDDQARASAKEIMGFFAGPGRQHHAEEEVHVFPLLLARKDPVMTAHIHRLQQDHGWIEEDWRELAPQIEAVANGYNWYDLAMLRAALPVFTRLYHDHIALEESLIYPEAKRQKEAIKQAADERGAAH
ncbi:MAG: hemerythrin domain-containing protein [Burkholderiales bacterium]|nr:hemerythrin domain-containing protein [Burkholderiales bacterium]